MRRLFAAALMLVTAACPPLPDIPDVPDAGEPQRAAAPVRVVSWNLRQLGADGGTAVRPAQVLKSLAPDLVAVQEIVTEEAFADLATRLPGFSSSIGPLAPTAGGLRQGWLWRTDRINLRDPGALFADAGVDFPRPPLEAVAEVLDDAGVRQRFVVVAVHLKAGAKPADEDRRVQALALLERHLRAIVDTDHRDDEVLLVGDYNEDLNDPRSAEAFGPFTGDPARYRMLTFPLADAGVKTFLPKPLFFDHLVATVALDEERDGGMPRVPPLNLEQADYVTAVSDHLPVVLDLTF